MARVHLLSSAVPSEASPYVRRDFERLARAAGLDRFKVHVLEPEPERAEVILFVGSSEPDQWDVRSHALRRRYPRKCFLFESGDRTLPFVPGVYTCAEKSWRPRSRFRAGFYPRVFENQAIQHSAVSDALPYLFSFVGSPDNAPVRQRLMTLRHPRALLIDASQASAGTEQRDGVAGAADRFGARYVESLRQSKFVLCPRGIGTSSWRLFETMKTGRAPVIISDDWVAPGGPDWSAFSIRVPEGRIEQIPRLLEAAEGSAVAMGQRAREAWVDWFSEEVAFHRVVEWCLEIEVPRFVKLDLGVLTLLPTLARPFYFRHWVARGLRRTMGL